MVKYVSTYWVYTLKKKRSAKKLLDDVYAISFLIFFIKAYVVGTHLNCLFVCVEVLRPSQPNGGHVERGQFT